MFPDIAKSLLGPKSFLVENHWDIGEKGAREKIFSRISGKSLQTSQVRF